MKNLSKALALLVVMAIMISSVAMAAVFPDVADDGSALANAINVDAALGLIEGYEDGTFQPEGSITRAEFAAIVVRMRNQEAQAQGAATTTDFADVPADHWAAGYINIASRLGIINGYGDGNFGPEDPVLYEQAIKMVVVALGYDKAVGEAGYPVGYLTQAGSMGLTSGLNGVNGAEANRGLVAQIVFNALDIPLMIQDGYGIYAQYVIADGYNTSYKQTVLSEYLGVVKVQGIVDSSSVLSSSSSKGETVNVKITNNYKTKHDDVFAISGNSRTTRFAVGATDASSFVGSKVMIYAAYDENSSDDPEIVYIAKETRGTYEETLTSTQVEDVTDEGDYILVKYRETPTSKTQQSYRIDKGSNLYINGVATLSASVTAIKDALLNNFYGYVTFSNLDATNDYDTLEVTTYKNLVVETNSTVAGRVTAKNTSASITYASNDNTVKATLYGTDGKEMKWEDLKEWDVLTYTEAEGSGSIVVYTAWLVENSVTGTVDGVQYEGTEDVIYEINGEDYELDNILSYDEISLGDEGTFYLDKLGNIAWYDASAVSDNFAYVSGAMYWKDFNPTIQVQLFNKEGKIETYLMNTSVKINGNTTKLNNMSEDELDDLAATFEGKLVVYKTNSNNEISAIDTAKSSGKKNEFVQYGGTEFATATYNEATNGFKPAGRSTVFATDKTSIFYVNGNDKDDYEILSLASLSDDDEFSQISFYNVDDNNEVGAILVKGEYDAQVITGTVAVVQSTSSTTDTYGQDVFKINAFRDSTDVSYVTNTKLGSADIPTIGSAFIPVVTSNSVSKIRELTVVDTSNDTVKLGDYAKSNTNDDVVFYMGNIKQVKGQTVILDNDETLAIRSTANIYLFDNRLQTKYALSKNEDLSAVLVTYDSKTGETTYEDRGEDITDYVIFAREYQGRIVDVVLYINLEYVDGKPAPAPTEAPSAEPTATPEPSVEPTATPEA